MAQTKKKSNVGSIILAVVLVLIIVAGIIVLCIPKDKPEKVMQVDINPSCQFVLNKDNRVVSVNCVNDDAQIVLQGANFVGMTAEQAAQTLVKISTEAGYIQVDKEGNATTANGADRVTIKISVSTNVDTEKLQKSIVDSVNKYFDDNGIIYGAVCSKVEGFVDALDALGVKAEDYANKTEAEMLELMGKTTKELEGIAREKRAEFYKKYDELKKKFDVQKLEDAITKIQAQVDEAQKLVDKYQAEVKEYKKSIDSLPEGPAKEAAKTAYDNTNKLLDTARNSLNELNKQLDEAKKNLRDTMNKLEAELDKTIKDLEEKSKKVYEEAKKVLQQKYDDAKELLKQHKDYFEQNKEKIKQKIEQYRTKLI